MSTVPTSPLAGSDLTGGQGLPHPLYVAEDDILYIGSGRFVHSYDGTSDTFNSQVLKLPINFEVTGFAETQFHLVVFASTGKRTGRRAEAKAFFWGANRGNSFDKAVSLEEDDIAAPFAYNGTVGCFTRNRNSSRSVLRIYDNTRFVPVFFWNNNLPSIGGVEIQDNMIKWNSSGQIYAWGSKDGLFDQAAFHFDILSGLTSGFLKSFTGGTLYASSGTGVKGIQTLTNFATGAALNTLTAMPVFPRGQRGKVKEVRVTYPGIASGGRALSITMTVNGSQTTKQVILNKEDITSTQLVSRHMLDVSGAQFPEFTDLRVNLNWGDGGGAANAIGVEKVEIFFDTINFT